MMFPVLPLLALLGIAGVTTAKGATTNAGQCVLELAVLQQCGLAVNNGVNVWYWLNKASLSRITDSHNQLWYFNADQSPLDFLLNGNHASIPIEGQTLLVGPVDHNLKVLFEYGSCKWNEYDNYECGGSISQPWTGPPLDCGDPAVPLDGKTRTRQHSLYVYFACPAQFGKATGEAQRILTAELKDQGAINVVRV